MKGVAREGRIPILIRGFTHFSLRIPARENRNPHVAPPPPPPPPRARTGFFATFARPPIQRPRLHAPCPRPTEQTSNPTVRNQKSLAQKIPVPGLSSRCAANATVRGTKPTDFTHRPMVHYPRSAAPSSQLEAHCPLPTFHGLRPRQADNVP